MQREEVKPELVTAIGYDAKSQTLMIEFRHHKPGAPPKVYTYTPFSAEQFAAFKAAPSIGKHFLAVIKTDSKLTYKRIEEASEEKKAEAPQTEVPAKDETQA